MEISEFLRIFSVRTPQIMWFLGAGASASAGIPTANDMVWDFKRRLYCSSQNVPLYNCSDLGSSVLRSRLQNYFDAEGKFPTRGDDDEYATYFEETYKEEADRRRYIDQLISGKTFSYGHLALAALLKLDDSRIVWTTNFDTLIEDAAFHVYKSVSEISIADLDNPIVAREAKNNERWPLIVKLHGDFRSTRIKNIPSELQSQDIELRRRLVDCCKQYGLVVVGYSGRDNSILNTLREAIDEGRGFPMGLYWLKREGGDLSDSVENLIEDASKVGISAEIIEIQTFDELVGDLIGQKDSIPDEIQELLKPTRPRVSDAPIDKPSNNWPYIRLNALPIIEFPSICRLVNCEIGGTAEVKEVVKKTNANIIATRRNIGVLAFGNDKEIRQTFESFEIKEFDVHSIEPQRLSYETAELGFIYESLICALARERPLIAHRRRQSYFLAIDPNEFNDPIFGQLRNCAKNLSGKVQSTDLGWTEAVRIKLEYRLNQLWLIFEPTIYVESSPNVSERFRSGEFIRSRTSGRFNGTWNQLLHAWSTILTDGKNESEINALGISDGLDASFTMNQITAFAGSE